MKTAMSTKQRVTADDEGVEFVLANGDVIHAYIDDAGALTVCADRGKIMVLPRADSSVALATLGFVVDKETRDQASWAERAAAKTATKR